MLFSCQLCKTLQSITPPLHLSGAPPALSPGAAERWRPDCHKLSGWVLGSRSCIPITRGLLNMEGVCFDVADGGSLARCLSSWQGRDAVGKRGSGTVCVLSQLEETHLWLLPLPGSNTPIHHSPSPALLQGISQCFAAIFLHPLVAVAVIQVALAGVWGVMNSLRKTATGRAPEWVLTPTRFDLKTIGQTVSLKHNWFLSILKRWHTELQRGSQRCTFRCPAPAFGLQMLM